MRGRWLTTGFAAAVVAGTSFVQARAAKPEVKPKVVLVELFTSEGCSSCPPADALLRQIDGTETSAGQMIVGISEHVTYWNQLGWADPFSSQTYTARQNAYGERFGLDSVYTPQMVVNGVHQFVGSDRNGLLKAIREEQDHVLPVDVHIVSTSVAGNVLTVKFSAAGESLPRGAEIVAVLADDADQSNVLRGENSGRTLAHVAVARSMTRVGKLKAGADQVAQIEIPAASGAAKGHHLILFAQEGGNGRILGIDSGKL